MLQKTPYQCKIPTVAPHTPLKNDVARPKVGRTTFQPIEGRPDILTGAGKTSQQFEWSVFSVVLGSAVQIPEFAGRFERKSCFHDGTGGGVPS